MLQLDLAQLPEPEAARLRALVAAALLPPAESRGTLLKREPQSWDFVHELTVVDDIGTRRIRYHLEAATPELRALDEAVRRSAEAK